MVAAPLQFSGGRPRLQRSLGRAAKLAGSDHQHFLVEPAVVDIVDQRGHHLIVHGQSKWHDRRQVDVDRVIVPTWRVHRLDAAGNADRDEAHAGLHQSSRHQGIPPPLFAVLGDESRIFLAQIECGPGLVRRQDLDGGAVEFVHRIHDPFLIHLASHLIELPE